MVMTFMKAQKMRIYPNAAQRKQIDVTLDCSRFVFNQMLSRNIKIYDRRGEHLSYYDMQNLMPVMKRYLPWLAEADSQALNYACRCVDTAYQKFFRGEAGFPNFKRKHTSRQSYTTTNPAGIAYEPGKVRLPRLGWMKASNNREPFGRICRATVSREHDKYYVSILYKFDRDVPDVEVKRAIGLDYRSDGLYVDSEGHAANMPHWYKEAEEAIKKEQRKLSKKKPHSNNRAKQQKRLAKKHRKAANQRLDYQHKLTTQIANEYDAVCIEDLDMQAMSNKGFGNGKATMDNGYGQFTSLLEYKLAERGKQLIKVDKWFPSSQLCSSCGHQNPKVKDMTVKKWICPECGTHHDRDINAAVNILHEGLKQIA